MNVNLLNVATLVIGVLILTGCKKLATVTATESEQLHSTPSQVQTYRSLDDKIVLALISGDECELKTDQGILLCKYTRQDGALRILMTTLGTTQVVYYHTIAAGLRNEKGMVLFSPDAYKRQAEHLITFSTDGILLDGLILFSRSAPESGFANAYTSLTKVFGEPSHVDRLDTDLNVWDEFGVGFRRNSQLGSETLFLRLGETFFTEAKSRYVGRIEIANIAIPIDAELKRLSSNSQVQLFKRFEEIGFGYVSELNFPGFIFTGFFDKNRRLEGIQIRATR